MGLGSVLQVAMTGVAAAESIVAAISNNLANSRTPGYKASSVQLVSQAPQTQGNGSAATGGNGGTNPVQVGMGVAVGATTLDFSQGQVVLDDNPLGMCMEGPGLFILRGRQGERSYTRDGRFSLNSDHELVNVDGHQVLGFSADADFQVQRGKLVPLRIPLGRTFATSGGGAATLLGFAVERNGRIQGRFSDGHWRTLGQIRVARFANSAGLAQRGRNLYSPGPNSGLPVETDPDTQGAGAVLSGATEMSNTDVGQSLVDLQSASFLFQANAQVVQTSVHLLDELLHLRRIPR